MSYEVPSDERDRRLERNEQRLNRDLIRFSPTNSNAVDATGFGSANADSAQGVALGNFVMNPEEHIISIQLSWTGGTGTLDIGDIVDASNNGWQGKLTQLVSGDSVAGTGVFEPQNSTAFTDAGSVTLDETPSDWSGNYTEFSDNDGGIVIFSASVFINTSDGGDPTLDTIFGAKADGQFTTIKPKEGLELTITTGGNIDIASDVIISDTTFALLQFHEDNTTPDSNGSWSLVSGGSGGSTSSNSIKTQVRFATTGNNIFHPVYNMIIDGATEGVEGDRVLIKSQTTQADNGIYVIGTVIGISPVATATLTRATDFDNDSDVKASLLVAVEEGTTNENSLWILTTDNPITVGATALIFQEFTGSGDNLGNHTATQELKMKDFKIFLNTDEDQWIVGTAGGIGTVAPTGDTIDWFINSALVPIFGVTETDFNTNVPIKTFGVDTNSFMSFFRDYDVDSPAVDNLLGVITFEGHDDALNALQFANIGVFTENVTNGSEAARLSIQVAENGVTGLNAWTYRSDSVTHTNQLQVGSTDPLEYIFYRDDTGGATDGDELGQITFDGNNDDPVRATYAEITGISQNVIDTIEQGNLRFKVRNSGPLTTAYEIKGGAGFPAGKALHEFTGSIEVNNLLAGSNIELGTTHASDPDNVFNFNLGSGASAEVDIFTNVQDIIFRSVVFAGERMRITSSGSVPTTETTTSWTSYENPANLELYNDGQGNVANDDVLGTIKFYGDTSGSGAQSRVEYGSIRVEAIDSTEPASGGIMKFNIRQQDSLITYLRIDGDGVAPDSTLGVLVSEKPFKMQTIYPNTAADIGYSNATWQNSFIDEMHCDRILFDETEAPTRADTSIGADTSEVWINHDALVGAFNIRWNDQVSVSEIRHQFTFSDYISKNGGNDHVIRNNIESMLFSQSNGDHWIFAGNNHTRFELAGIGFTVAGLNDDEILFDSSNSTAGDIVGQIHFTGVTDTAAEFDIAKIVAKNQVPTNASRSGLLEFKLSQSGSENTTFMIMDGFFDKIETFATFDIGSHYIEMDSISAPTHSTATKRFLFADSGNSNHLSVRTDSTVIDLETGGGGATDKIEEGNSFIEVIDAGTGSLEFNIDGTSRGTWNVANGFEIKTSLDMNANQMRFNSVSRYISNASGGLSLNNASSEPLNFRWGSTIHYNFTPTVADFDGNILTNVGSMTSIGNITLNSSADIDFNTGNALDVRELRLTDDGSLSRIMFNASGAGDTMFATNISDGDRIDAYVNNINVLAFFFDTSHSRAQVGITTGLSPTGVFAINNNWELWKPQSAPADAQLDNGDGLIYFDTGPDPAVLTIKKKSSVGVVSTVSLEGSGGSTSFIGFTADDNLDMDIFSINWGASGFGHSITANSTQLIIDTGVGGDDLILKTGGGTRIQIDDSAINMFENLLMNNLNINNVDTLDFNSSGSIIQQLDTLTMLDSGALINVNQGHIENVDHIDFNSDGSFIQQLDTITMLDSGSIINMNSGRINNLENVSGTPTFSGDVFFNEDVTLGNSSADNINFNGDFVGHITPNVDDTYSVGSASQALFFAYIESGCAVIEGYSTGFKPAGQTNIGILFCVPTAGGKTQLRCSFQTGGSQVIVEEP